MSCYWAELVRVPPPEEQGTIAGSSDTEPSSDATTVSTPFGPFNTTFCRKCAAIDFKWLIHSIGRKLSIMHAGGSLKAGALSGCEFCALAYHPHMRMLQPGREPFDGDAELAIMSRGFTCHRDYAPVPQACIGFDIKWIVRTGRRMQMLSLATHMMVPGEGDWPYAGLYNPFDFKTVDLWRSWMNECTSTHMDCPGDVDQDLPDRLLVIGSNDGMIRLAETNGMVGRYVALSHCWGGNLTFLTTRQNYRDRLLGIPVATMPTTFKDAVMLTRSLGYSYLWIDSLCITQDDASDWQRQCSKMADIYSRAVVTIAASAARDSTEGLHCRTVHLPEPQYACELKLSGTDTTTTASVRLINLNMQERFETKEPLAKRGWAVQEHILSPRLLRFKSNCVTFECQSAYRTDSFRYPQPLANIHGGEGTHKDFNPWIVAKDAVWAQDRETLLEHWYRILAWYAHCELSKRSDKLPAVSGIARRFAERLKLRYLAGLWDGDIAFALSYHLDGFGISKPSLEHQPKPEAPSWSWASFDVDLKYETRLGASGPSCQTKDRYYVSLDSSTIERLPGGDDFAQMGSARLTLTVYLIKVPPQRADVQEYGKLDYGLHDLEPAEGPRREFYEDHRFTISNDNPDLYLMLLWNHNCATPECYRCRIAYMLVLHPVPSQPDTFRRIGVVKFIMDGRLPPGVVTGFDVSAWQGEQRQIFLV